MSEKKLVMIDGNTAAGHVAHALSEVIALSNSSPKAVLPELCTEL